MKYKIADGLLAEKVADELAVTLPNGDIVVLNEPAEVALRAVLESPDDIVGGIADALARRYNLNDAKAVSEGRYAAAQFRRAGVLVPARISRPNCKKSYKRVTRRAFVAGMAAAGLSLAMSSPALGEESAAAAKRGYAGNSLASIKAASGKAQSLTDSLGRSVEVPRNIEKVTPYGPLAQALMESIDPDMVVAASVRGLHASIYDESDTLEAQLSAQADEAAELDVYELEAQEPDIVLDIAVFEEHLCTEIDAQADESGVPIVHLVVDPGDLPAAYRFLGELLDREDRCNELADYVASIDVTLAQLREQISEDSRKRVYYGQGYCGLDTRGGSTLVGQAITSAACLNVVDELKESDHWQLNAYEVDELSPDLCLLYIESGYYQDGTIAPVFSIWDSSCLGYGREVYRVPEEPNVWFATSPLLTMTLGALWVAWLAYPDLCGYEFSEVSKEYFEKMFQYGISSSEMDELSTQGPAFELESRLP